MKLSGKWLAQAHTIHRVVQVDSRRILLHTLLLGLAFSGLLGIPFVFYQQAESENNLSLLRAEQERVLKLATATIQQEIEAVQSDLRYLSQHNELLNYLASPTQRNRLELAREYLVVSRQKGVYEKIRFIGPDGKERVRVDFGDSGPSIAADAALRDLRGRYYFDELFRLAPGRIYVSPLDLSSELRQPVMRFAVPVADNHGQIRGAVVLNYMAQRLRSKLAALNGPAGRISLLNRDGYWLMGPTPADEWGFVYPERAQRRAAVLFPAMWAHMAKEPAGVHQSASSWTRYERIYPLLDSTVPTGGSTFARPVDAERYYWTVGVELSNAAAEAANSAMRAKLRAVYGALAGFAFLVAGALAFVINRNKALVRVMEKVLDDLPVLVGYVDAEQRYRFNNNAYQRLFGVSVKEIYGRTMCELLGEEAYQAVRGHIEQALAGESATFERQVPHAGAMLQLSISYLPDVSTQGEVRGFYVMASDITRIKESEQRDRQRMLELAHVSRLASMGQMATEIAHEINQPLAAIAMYSSAGLRTLQGERGQIGQWLEAINTQAKRASEIVKRVRRFVQKEAVQFGPVDMNAIAGDVADLLGHEARAQQVVIVLELAEGLPSVRGERVLLEQVLFNLTRNAMDAVLAQPGARRITLRTTFDVRHVYVEVCDTGPGVDPALAQHIFESFVTSKQEGLGMGLTISRSIIETHGGTLRYAQGQGGGSTFGFSLARGAD